MGAAKGERSISHNDLFTTGQGNAGTDWIRGWVTTTTILDAVKRENHVAQRLRKVDEINEENKFKFCLNFPKWQINVLVSRFKYYRNNQQDETV